MPTIIENRVLKKYSGNDTQFTVPEGVTKIGEWVFNGYTCLTQITIPEGVAEIGSYAFIKCSSLIQINIPEGVTKIGYSAFSRCSSLTQVNIPEGVTKIGEWAFFMCTNLTQINIPEGMSEIPRYAFNGCTRLTQINILEGVTEIGEGAFAGCVILTQITIPHSVTKTGEWAFAGCIRLTQITIPEGVTEIGDEAFYKCINLTQINIPQGLTEMGENVFQDCANLQRIVVSNNNDVVRVKSYLPDETKDKVTSYYLQHQQNINKIRHSQLALYSRSLNLFMSSLNNNVTGLIYLFLSFQDMMSLSCVNTGLKPIKDIAQSIQAVKYREIIPRIKPPSPVKTSFLQQYTPNENDKELTDYHRSLNQYKWNLRKSISASLSELKSNNKNEEKNDRGMLCRLL